VHLGVLDEQTSRDVLLHLLPGHEVVVHALLLAGSWLASRVRDGEAELVWELGRQLLDESGLAYAAGPCHDASTSHTRRGPPHRRNLRLGFQLFVGRLAFVLDLRHRWLKLSDPLVAADLLCNPKVRVVRLHLQEALQQRLQEVGQLVLIEVLLAGLVRHGLARGLVTHLLFAGRI